MQPLVNSDGSAEYSQTVRDPRENACKVICSVNGPLEARVRDELPTQATLETVIMPNVGVPSIREALMQDQIHSCLLSILVREAIPRSLVQIVVQVLEAGEPQSQTVNELAAGVNAASIALANAAVPLSGLCVAVSCAFVQNEAVTSPTSAELEAASSSHIVVFKYDKGPDSPEKRVVFANSTGSFTQNEFIECLDQCEVVSKDMYLSMRETISNTYKEGTKWSN